MKTELYPPSRCTAKLPDDLDKEYLIAEEKLDGSRYVLYLACDPYERQKGNALLSRRVSTVDGKHVDRTGNVPHITDIAYPGLDGTVLDGEMKGDVEGETMGGTSSVMGSSPALAVEKQKRDGLLKYYVWDVMSYRGKDIRGLPLSDRRKVLEAVVAKMGNPHIVIVEQVPHYQIADLFKSVVGRGGEGVVVKDLRVGYGLQWSKYKKSFDVSVVVSGFKPGKGKYDKMVGALALSVYDGKKLIEIGFASGFDDKVRLDITKNPKKYLGRVVDVFAQEVTKPTAEHSLGRFRHATFHRFRDDVNAEDCTFAKLTSDMKASKVKGSRKKED